MTQELKEKIDYSVNLIRKAQNLAMKMNPEKGFWLAFSGGKDSQCVYHLAKMAGVKSEAHYSLTTLDPPELVYFMREQYPDVIVDRPKHTFLQLCEKNKMMPTRLARFCCRKLKESYGKGCCTIIGIRKQESRSRATRNELENVSKKREDSKLSLEVMEERRFECLSGKERITLAPILEWTTADVWEFLNDVVKVGHCSLYDEGWERIGCLFCPNAKRSEIAVHEQRYPKYKAAILRTMGRIMEMKPSYKEYFTSPDEFYAWWISNKAIGDWKKQNLYGNKD